MSASATRSRLEEKGNVDGRRPAARLPGADGKLTTIESEAETVRLIFRRYAELGSVRLLKDELQAGSIHSKLRTSASGRISGGKPCDGPGRLDSFRGE